MFTEWPAREDSISEGARRVHDCSRQVHRAPNDSKAALTPGAAWISTRGAIGRLNLLEREDVEIQTSDEASHALLGRFAICIDPVVHIQRPNPE